MPHTPTNPAAPTAAPQAPSYREIIRYVLSGPATSRQSYRAGVEVYCKSVLDSHETDDHALITYAVAAALPVAVKGHSDQTAAVAAAWARFDAIMQQHQPANGGGGTTIKSRIAHARTLIARTLSPKPANNN